MNDAWPEMHHRMFRGRIDYRHDEYGETGREWFRVTAAPDGGQTVRATCEMDDLALLRDVVYTIGPGFEPLECYNRVTIRDQLQGSSLFRFDGRHVRCTGVLGDGRAVAEEVELSRRTPVFACHPLYCDGWHAGAYDHGAGERRQLLVDCTNSSMQLDGSSAPLLGVVRKGLEYVGREKVTVPAGTFLADRYRIYPMRVEAPDWTPLDFWVYGPDLVFIRLRWDMIRWTYELAEISGEYSEAVHEEVGT